MENWLSLGNSPFSEIVYFENEEWAEKYSHKVLVAWLNQLRRVFPNFRDRLIIKQASDEAYLVAITIKDETQLEQAQSVADELPYCWDDKSREELGSTYFKDTRKIAC